MQQFMQLLVATNNEGKLKEIQEILLKYKSISLKDIQYEIEVKEDGKTFEENATIKATTAANELQLPVMADDSGLMVDALGGAPGVRSARYAGDHDDAANNAKLLSTFNMYCIL